MLIACFGYHDHDRKVSAKSMNMRATTPCEILSGYREFLLNKNCFGSLIIFFYIYNLDVNISSKYKLWSVHGIMNTSGLLQS